MRARIRERAEEAVYWARFCVRRSSPGRTNRVALARLAVSRRGAAPAPALRALFGFPARPPPARLGIASPGPAAQAAASGRRRLRDRSAAPSELSGLTPVPSRVAVGAALCAIDERPWVRIVHITRTRPRPACLGPNGLYMTELCKPGPRATARDLRAALAAPRRRAGSPRELLAPSATLLLPGRRRQLTRPLGRSHRFAILLPPAPRLLSVWTLQLRRRPICRLRDRVGSGGMSEPDVLSLTPTPVRVSRKDKKHATTSLPQHFRFHPLPGRVRVDERTAMWCMGRSQIRCTTIDGTAMAPELVGDDPDTDLAVVRVNGAGRVAAPLGEPKLLRHGSSC